jgi:vacuolar-type H+-ATPase subunit H
MSMTNGRAKNSKTPESVLAGDGLEGELMTFINSLIDQNAELAAKVEDIDSLTELAERSVIEAGREAERIRAEAEKEAASRSADIMAKAIEKASAAAQEIIATAKDKVEAEARRVIAEANQKAEKQAREIMKAAEEEGSRIITEAREKAEEEALLIKKEAEQLLASGKKIEECQAIRDPWDVPDEIFWQYLGIQETKGAAMKEQGKPPEPLGNSE